tara:strand:+ start:1258 stop:1509 length:252 start_codon:yes stop_codon:yes gene_type:complete
MHNLFRFITGLIGFVLLLGIILVTLLLVWPILLGGAIIFLVLFILGIVLFVIFSFFAFFWYLTRKEPKHERKDYSIKQGKEVK